MPDLLTHVLVAYAIVTALSRRWAWMTPGHVTAAMAGALVPDLDHVSMVVPPALVHDLLGVPISWGALQTGGPVFLVLVAGTLLVEKSERRRVFGLLSLGALTHLLADALIRTPDGHSQSVFWPLTRYQPPTPGLYTSADVWPLLLSGVAAVVAWRFASRYEETCDSDARP